MYRISFALVWRRRAPLAVLAFVFTSGALLYLAIGAPEALGAALDVHRVHAHGGEAVLLGLVAELVDVGVGGLGAEQGVVDELREVVGHGVDAGRGANPAYRFMDARFSHLGTGPSR